MKLHSKIITTVIALSFVVGCEKPEEKQTPPPPPPKVEQPAPPPNPFADNPFVKAPPTPLPPPVPPIGNQTLPLKLKYIGDAKLNDAWTMCLWRDEANRVSCYFADGNDGHHEMSCVRDEVAPTK